METNNQINSNNTFKLLYPISPAHSSRLAGIIHASPIACGRIIEINSNKYTVKRCEMITIKFYVVANRTKIFRDFQTFSSRDQQNRFINSIGFDKEITMVAHLFHNAQIVELTAIKKCYYISFTDLDLFEI